MSKRDTRTTIAVGMKEVGKSHYTKHFLIDKYVKNIGDQPARPVIALDTTGEFSKWGYKAVYYNPYEENFKKRVKNLEAINRPNVYRLFAKYANGMQFTKKHIIQAISDIYQAFNNGMFLFEDINKIMGSHLSDDFISMLVSNRHYGLDLVMHYQSFAPVPPQLLNNTDYLRLHNTVNSVMSLSTNKITHLEMIRIGELVVEHRYSYGDIYYCCLVNQLKKKLEGVSEKDFEIACNKYLRQTPKELKLYLTEEDDNGKKLYKTRNAAIKAVIEDKKKLYL